MSIFGGRKDKKPSVPPAESKPLAAPQIVPRQPVGFESVLGANATLKGDLKSQANVRLDGTFEGTLEIDGNVLVGETAKITADIHAKNVSIAGAVRGDVSGKKVQLLRTGRVWGDITATAIATEEGAFIEGKITMISHDAAETFDPNAMPLPEVDETTDSENDPTLVPSPEIISDKNPSEATLPEDEPDGKSAPMTREDPPASDQTDEDQTESGNKNTTTLNDIKGL